MINQELCPCKSQLLYAECCQKFHEGKVLPPNALALMRSRYSAYAKEKIDYIMETSHGDNPKKAQKKEDWIKEIQHFSRNTQFVGLEILEFVDGEREAFVTFRAVLQQGDKDVSFTERSRFLKDSGRWFYVDGVRVG